MSTSPFQYVSNAVYKKDSSGDGFESFIVNRVLSSSSDHIFPSNILNELSYSKLTEETKKIVATKYLNSLKWFKYKYIKGATKLSKDDEDVVLKLSELLKCPFGDAKRYIEDGLYNTEEILDTYRIERD